uniref:Uncharacterized protein n=1 Tax=Cacopsylla melanoneura TaxID=428564 RepID=A0A8D9ENC8_9HEMI
MLLKQMDQTDSSMKLLSRIIRCHYQRRRKRLKFNTMETNLSQRLLKKTHRCQKSLTSRARMMSLLRMISFEKILSVSIVTRNFPRTFPTLLNTVASACTC